MSNEYEIEEIISNNIQEDYLIKIIVVGDCAVGKSNILSRLISNDFMKESKSTIGVELSSKIYRIDKKIIKINIWDTAGQEKFTSITTIYYKGAKGAFIVYDITRKDTYNNIDKWLRELRTKISNSLNIILIGNKCDLFLLRKVDYKEAKEKARQLNLDLFETSALDSTNITNAFKKMIVDIYANLKKNNFVDSDSSANFPLNSKCRKEYDIECNC